MANMAEVTESDLIAGVVLVRPDVFGDDRGVFVQTYRREWFPDGREMIQSNRSDRRKGCVVGLHYHLHQADYWYIVSGTARVVLHDLRLGSPTHGATFVLDLGDQPDGAFRHDGVYIPPGVAHGFAALSDVMMTYMVDEYYNPADELGVAWNDPAIGADWGIADPQLSTRDQASSRRDQLAADLWPTFVNEVEQ